MSITVIINLLLHLSHRSIIISYNNNDWLFYSFMICFGRYVLARTWVLTQEQSLALLMKPEVVRINIADQLTSIPEVWTPSLLLDNFINRKFIKEMEEVDNILSGSDKTNP